MSEKNTWVASKKFPGDCSRCGQPAGAHYCFESELVALRAANQQLQEQLAAAETVRLAAVVEAVEARAERDALANERAECHVLLDGMTVPRAFEMSPPPAAPNSVVDRVRVLGDDRDALQEQLAAANEWLTERGKLLEKTAEQLAATESVRLVAVAEVAEVMAKLEAQQDESEGNRRLRRAAEEERDAALAALEGCIGPGHREYLTRGAVEKAEAALSSPAGHSYVPAAEVSRVRAQVEAKKDAAYIMGVNDAVLRIKSWADNVLDGHPESAGRSILLTNVAAAVRELVRDKIKEVSAPAPAASPERDEIDYGMGKCKTCGERAGYRCREHYVADLAAARADLDRERAASAAMRKAAQDVLDKAEYSFTGITAGIHHIPLDNLKAALAPDAGSQLLAAHRAEVERLTKERDHYKECFVGMKEASAAEVSRLQSELSEARAAINGNVGKALALDQEVARLQGENAELRGEVEAVTRERDYTYQREDDVLKKGLVELVKRQHAEDDRDALRAQLQSLRAEVVEECAKAGEAALSKLFAEGMARNVPHVIGDAIRALYTAGGSNE